MTEELLVKTLLDARPRLIAGAFAVVRNGHAAEDVFQEVLLRALRMRESFSDEGGLLAWARVSSRNLGIDQVRRLHNPEPAELLRGKSGRAIGQLTALLVMQKGLPLAYNSDLQEDKEAVFDTLDTAAGALRAALPLTLGLHYNPARMADALAEGFLTATDLADHLVQQGVPFRTAHAQAGQAVRAAEELGVALWALPAEVLVGACPAADPAVAALLTPEASVRGRTSPGAPAPERVREQLASARIEHEDLRGWLAARTEAPIYVAHRAGRLWAESLP